MIFDFALVNVGGLLVLRDGLQPLPSMRYRCNKIPKLWKEIHPEQSVDGASHHADRYDTLRADLVEPVKSENYAFGLFLASHKILDEAAPIFYGRTTFVFEDRFSLHMFLKAIGRNNVQHLKSVSLSWWKRSGLHSEEVRYTHEQWQLRPEVRVRSSLANSLQELRNNCPKLKHLGMLPWYPNVPSADSKEFRDWKSVKQLRAMELRRFSFILPSDDILLQYQQKHPEAFESLKNEVTAYREIEAYINNQTSGGAGG